MKPKYVVHYTLFGLKYNGFKSYYRFFETEEQRKVDEIIENIKENGTLWQKFRLWSILNLGI